MNRLSASTPFSCRRGFSELPRTHGQRSFGRASMSALVSPWTNDCLFCARLGILGQAAGRRSSHIGCDIGRGLSAQPRPRRGSETVLTDEWARSSKKPARAAQRTRQTTMSGLRRKPLTPKSPNVAAAAPPKSRSPVRRRPSPPSKQAGDPLQLQARLELERVAGLF